MISDAVVKERQERAKCHTRKKPVGSTPDRVGRLARIHTRETAVRHLRDDRSVHQEKLRLAVAAHDGEPRVISALAIDDVRDGIGHVDADTNTGRVLSTGIRSRDSKSDYHGVANEPVDHHPTFVSELSNG